MKKIILSVITLVMTLSLSAQVNSYGVGDVVDNFTVTDTDGNEWSLYDITAEGKYVYLDFFFANCGPCQETSGYFNEFHETYGCNQGELFMIAINGTGEDSDQAVIDFEDEFGGDFNHPPAVSGDGGGGAVGSNFGINAYPTYCLIGPDNKLLIADIWPVSNASTFVNTVPEESGAEPMECSLAVNEVAAINFTMHPNPSNGNELNIMLPEDVLQANVIVYNTIGQQVFAAELNANQNTITPSLKTGAYLVNVIANGATSTQSLLVK